LLQDLGLRPDLTIYGVSPLWYASTNLGNHPDMVNTCRLFIGEKNLIDDFGHNAWKWGAINWDIDSSQWFWEQSLHIPTPDDTLQLQRLTIGEICGLISRSYTYGEPRTVLPELALGIHIQSDIETGQCRLLEQLFIR
jgi:hypothetical protein